VRGGVRTLVGNFTISCNRTIAGISTTSVADRQTEGSSGVTIGSARPANINTTARRSLTNCSGSKVAFSNSTRPMATYGRTGWRSDHLAAWTMASGVSGVNSLAPYVVIRKCQYEASGRGRKGARRHQPVARKRHPTRASIPMLDG